MMVSQMSMKTMMAMVFQIKMNLIQIQINQLIRIMMENQMYLRQLILIKILTATVNLTEMIMTSMVTALTTKMKNLSVLIH